MIRRSVHITMRSALVASGKLTRWRLHPLQYKAKTKRGEDRHGEERRGTARQGEERPSTARHGQARRGKKPEARGGRRD